MENLGVLVLAMTLVARAPEVRVAHLEMVLNGAFDDDEPIELFLGADFEAPPGAVVFAPREEGARRLVGMARAGEDELAMLYLPEWEAWITCTIERRWDSVDVDLTYLYAAHGAGFEPEDWHTHNDVGEPVSRREKRMRDRQWTLPSENDIRRVYYFERDMPSARYVGIVAHVHGVTVFRRSRDLSDGWAQPRYREYAIIREAMKLLHEIRKVPLPFVPSYLKSHKGLLEIRLNRVR